MIMDVLLRRKLKEMGMTDFQISVLDATSNIPAGQVRTYKEIAIEIGHPNACRAVGTALRKNPFPVTIPCHRVIKSSGEPGKYSGKSGTRKIKLLQMEGVKISNGIVNQKRSSPAE
ncbi:Methylated-DNA--protein-cysteine methyltransferase [Candidatus Micrarchaeum sp.]|jgi:O-6-methylguanine DNA methyltransferase|uniref:methylated-DNA--[protein]-cysteine S-methyltransferase n=1 Tax=Candidatus Micrarchaeum sp. TaxID=2282148 RepID=UPI000AFEA73B|nr:MGMT family protein [Candidatus Micrarchaeum sp.]QRF73694.1 Methylated-DNA--protein-cysteine methyltransferase [Candidatus Micrarchaeum sp.]